LGELQEKPIFYIGQFAAYHTMMFFNSSMRVQRLMGE